MALDVETLLAPVSEEQPVGEDLAYDNERVELEQAFERSESAEEIGGDTEERDWRAVLKLIENQFKRTKDIWLAVYLARAGAESGALETVELGAEVLAGLFERYWDTVHPQLEELGLPGRKAPCDALASRASFLGPLERTILISHPRLGRYSGLDLERFRIEGAAGAGYGMFRAALEEVGVDGLGDALARLDRIEDALRRVDRIFTAGAGGEDTPSFHPTYAVLNTLKQGVGAFLPADAAGGADGEGDSYGGGGGGGSGAAASGGGGIGGAGKMSGAIASRDDVVRALGMIGDYYRNREPGHPMPHLLERARQWIDMDFFALMKDIAPDGVDQAQVILKNRPTEDDSY